MIGGVGLAQAGELVVLGPVEFAPVHHDAAHDGAVAAHELGGGVDHDVRPVLQRPQQIGRGEGAVHDEGDAVAVGDGGDGLQVDDVGIGVAQGLGIHELRIGLDGLFEILRVGRVHEGGGKPLLHQGIGKEIVGAAIEIGGGDDVIPRHGDILNGIGDGGASRGGGQGARPALQGSDALFKHVGGGVHEAGIDIALLRQGEAAGGLGAVLEHIGGGGVDRHGPGVGGGVGRFLPRMDLDGFESIIRHSAASFLIS